MGHIITNMQLFLILGVLVAILYALADLQFKAVTIKHLLELIHGNTKSEEDHESSKLHHPGI